MNDKKMIKISAAAAITMSAITPVAVFAAESDKAANGFYTGDKYYSGKDFRALSSEEKRAVFLDPNTVIVAEGQVVFLKDITGKTNAELMELAQTEEAFEAMYGQLTENGYEPVDSSVIVESVSAINATSVKVTFNKEVEELAVSDVVVTNKETTEKQYVKSVELAEDGKSATVVFYEALTKGTYTVAVTDAGSKELNFEVAAVAEITAETTQTLAPDNSGDIAVADIDYKVLDVNGLDITDITTVTYESTKTITSGKIALATGETAFVYVVYTKTDGSTIKSPRITVKSAETTPATIADVTTAISADRTDIDTNAEVVAKFTAKEYKQNLNVGKSTEDAYVIAYAKDQYGKDYKSTVAPTFESLDKTVALVDRNSGLITPVKEGKFLVKVTFGDVTKTVELAIVADAELDKLEPKKTEVTLSNKVAAGETIAVQGLDQYGNKIDGNTISVKPLTNTGIFTVTGGTDAVTVKPVAGKSGTGSFEISVGEVKTVVTVVVTEAGDIDGYKLQGFEAELDKYAANTDTKESATLSVIPVDANGVATGTAVSATYTIKDSKGAVVNNQKDISTNTAITVANAAFKVDEEYTVEVKVGDVVVATEKFKVIDTEKKPTITFTGAVNDLNGDLNIKDELIAGIDITDAGSATALANLSVTDVTFTSDAVSIVGNNGVVLKEGNATLLVDTVTLTDSSDNTPITLELSELISAKVDYSAKGVTASKFATAPIGHASDFVKNGQNVSGSYDSQTGVFTISADFANLKAEANPAGVTAQWLGVKFSNGTHAGNKAQLIVKDKDGNVIRDLEVDDANNQELNSTNGFFWFFEAAKAGNEYDVTVAWKDAKGVIQAVETTKVKFVDTPAPQL